MSKKPERDRFSPDGQTRHKPNLRERWMLRRIGSRVLWLPEDEPIVAKSNQTEPVHVTGHRSGGFTTLHLVRSSAGEGEVTSEYTNISLRQNPDKSTMPLELSAERFTDDDVASLMGVSTSPKTFELANYENTLSLHHVMRSVVLAARIVSDAKTIEYHLSHPGVDDAVTRYSQTF